MKRTTLAIIALLVLGGCATAPRITMQRAAEPSEALDEAVERFYEASSPKALRDAVADAMRASPTSARAREIAAQMAIFDDLQDEAFVHWSRALLDPSNDAAGLHLLSLARMDKSFEQHEQFRDLVAALAEQHPDPALRSHAFRRLASELYLKGRAKDRDRALSAVGGWLDLAIIGPFDNDQGKGLDTEYPPERGVDLKASHAGHLTQVEWRVGQPTSLTARNLNLGELMWPSTNMLAYAAAAVEVPESGAHELRLTSSAALKIWVNGHLVFSNPNFKGQAAFDAFVIPVTLVGGVNQILIKSAQKRGAWNLSARLTRPGGGALDKVARQVPADTPASGGEAPDKVFDDEALLMMRLPERGEAISARDLALDLDWAKIMGLGVGRVAVAESYSAAHPDAIVGREGLVRALWDSQERARASDALTRLYTDAGEALPGVARLQIRFWTQQKLKDKSREALVDLVGRFPDRRAPSMALAGFMGRDGWWEDVCPIYEAVNRKWPGRRRVMKALARCLRSLHSGHPARALALNREILTHQRGHLSALSFEIDRALRNERPRDAEKIALERLRLVPYKGSYMLKVVEIRKQRGDLEGAMEMLDRMAKTNPTSPAAFGRMAKLAYQKGDLGRAVELWEAALARNPDNDSLATRVDFVREGGPKDPWFEDIPDEEAIEAVLAGRDKAVPKTGADNIILLDHQVLVLNADGSKTHYTTLITKATNAAGRDRLTKMRFSSSRRLLHAYVITPKGERVEASSIHSGTLRFREMSVGATRVVQYRRTSRPSAYLSGFSRSAFYFQGIREQSERVRWIVWQPESDVLKTHIVGQIKREDSARDGYRRVVFSADETAPLSPEPLMAPLQDMMWGVHLSTVPDWETVWRWEKALLHNAFRTSPEVETLAETLFDGARDKEEIVDRLMLYLMRDIRYQMDYNGVIEGVKPHAAPVIVARQYADCKDKAVLFITLARLKGIKAHFALVRTRPKGQVLKAVPGQQFNHAIVYLPAQEGIAEGRFLDPTTDELDVRALRSDDQGANSLVYDPDSEVFTWRTIPFRGPDEERSEFLAKIQMAADGSATVDLSWKAVGGTGKLLRQTARNEQKTRQLIERLASGLFPGATLEKIEVVEARDLSQPAHIRATIKAPQVARLENGALRFKIRSESVSPTRSFKLGTRQLPMHFGPPSIIKWRYEVSVPEGLKLVTEDAAGEKASKCFSVSRSLDAASDKLVLNQSLTFLCTRLEPDEYQAQRKAAFEAQTFLEKELVFTPVK